MNKITNLTKDKLSTFAQSISDTYWKKIETWIENFLRLEPLPNPNEVDAILLEDRILYSATPMAMLDGAEIEPVDSGVSPELIEAAQAYFDQYVEQECCDDISLEESSSNSISDDSEESTAQASGDNLRRELILIQGDLFSSTDILASFESMNSEGEVLYDVFVIDRLESGFAQIEALLAEYEQLDAIHIFSQSDQSGIEFGSDWLESHGISQFDVYFEGWKESFNSHADIIFYVNTLGDSSGDTIDFSSLASQISATANADALILTRTIDESFSQNSWAQEYRAGHIDSNVLILPTVSAITAIERIEVVFIDEGLEDFETLLADLTDRDRDGIRTFVFRISAELDGLEQVNAHLATLSEPVDAFHFLSHGTNRAFKLGSSWFDYSAIVARQAEFNVWSGFLAADADILFYACELASTTAGISVLELIADFTGADIAASSNMTGWVGWGGDWDLEFSLGSIETFVVVSEFAQENWFGVMDTFTVTNNANSGAGSLRQAILDANALAGHDTINFAIGAAGSFVTISIESTLTITDSVTINGQTQGGSSYSWQPLIHVRRAFSASVNTGFHVLANNVSISGIGVGRFQQDGILVENVSDFTLTNSSIGVNPSTLTQDANLRDGVRLNNVTNSMIGGTAFADRNMIALNGERGVNILGTSNNVAVLGNVFQGNPQLDLDLGGNGVTANDNLDGDSGPNGLQNFPVLSTAFSNQDGTRIVGNLNSKANTTYRIEVFGTVMGAQHSSGYGGARTLLGSFNVTTDAMGNASYDTVLQGWVNAGDRVTATATVVLGGGQFGSTSEFSQQITATSSGVVVVNTASSLSDVSITSITNLQADRGTDGRISIREAIQAANNTTNNGGVPDLIAFDILSWGRATITVSSSNLPSITDAVRIDASTQRGYNGIPLISLVNGDSRSIGFNLLNGSSGSTIRGFNIQGFSTAGISIVSNNNTIAGNWIGTNASGTGAVGNLDGIVIFDGDNNIIGGTGVHDRNVISGNTRDGIWLDGGANNTQILGNYIGLNASGNAQLSNVHSGIYVLNSYGTIIGNGTVAGRNVISGNLHRGIALYDGDNAIIQGNYIGTDVTGNVDINGLGSNSLRSGIIATNGTTGVVIGGYLAGQGNVISGNNWYGVEFLGVGTSNNLMVGNIVGLNATGTAALGNSAGGVSFFDGASNNTLGGGQIGARNIISANSGVGVYIGNNNPSGNKIQGNYIGIGLDGGTIFGNSSHGIHITSGAFNNIIGTDNDGSNDVGERNVISGNLNGIIVGGSGVNGNIIAGNVIGTDATGMLNRGNTIDGIRIEASATNNAIGGTHVNQRNVISGNSHVGIVLQGAGTSNNIVLGNYVGTNAIGTLAVGNGLSGIVITSGASANTIGGTQAGAGNLLSGNGNDGIALFGTGTNNNIIQGNLIGVNATATATISNGAQGIWIGEGAQSNIVGGTVVGAGNIVGGNTFAGIELHGANTSNNLIQGNFIGTNTTGTLNLGNGVDGILVQAGANNNTIGGTASGAGNTIAFNGRNGVRIESTAGSGNAILGNQIYSNNAIGINLVGGSQNGFGVTANDVGDGDSGPNDLQNYPVLFGAQGTSFGVVVQGSINSTANRTFRIEVFANTTADPSGHGEGQRFVGAFNVTTDGSGNATFDESVLGTMVNEGELVSMTATDLTTNSTSEFAAVIAATFINLAPSALKVTNSSQGGVQINQGDGNDTYFVADNGGAILGGLTALTFEFQFELSQSGVQHTFLNYAVPGTDNEVYLHTLGDGSLRFFIKGLSVSSNAIDFNSLVGTGQHTLSVTWSNSGGNWVMYLNGEQFASGTGFRNGLTLASGGSLVLGHDQDTVGGGFQAHQAFKGTFYDARIFNGVRTASQIASNYASTVPYFEPNLRANWTFNDLSTGGVVTDTVKGNNLTLQTINAPGFTASSTSLYMAVQENANNGSVVGIIYGFDAEREARIAQLLAADSSLRYSAETGSFYKLVSTNVSWTTALSAAQATTLGGVTGNLVTIQSAAENQIVWSLATLHGGEIWVGGTDRTIEGQWRWVVDGNDDQYFWQGGVNGYRIDEAYTNWTPSEPSETVPGDDYIRLRPSDGRWLDSTNNGFSLGYVIEWNADSVLDATNALTYSITSQSVSGAFTINASTGVITIADASLIDYEALSSHSVTIQVTDSGGLSFSQVFVISVNDVDFEPRDLFAVPSINTGNVVGYYSFTDGSDLGRDDAGDDQPITLFNGPTQTTGPNGSEAIDFNGTNQYGDISGLTTGGAMTVAAWVRFDTTGNWQRVFDFGGPDAIGIDNIYVGRLGSSNDLTFTIEQNGVFIQRATAVGAITNGTWMHFAATVDNSGNMILYVNGVQAATQSGVALTEAVRTNNYIGRSNWGGDAYFDGAIDDFLIARGTMSAADVSALYQQNNQFRVVENAITGTRVGTVFTAHPISGTTYTYSLTDDAGGRFAIHATTGVITVADGTLLDFESATSHNITVQVTDSFGNSYDEQMTINVSNLIESTLTVPLSTQSLAEDTTLVFNAANGNAITVSDTTAANSLMQVSLSVAEGTLTLSQTTGLTFAYGGNNSASMVIWGTESNINAALEGLTYTPIANYNGNDSLTITTSLAANLQGWYTFDDGTSNDQSTGVLQNGTFFGNASTVTDPTLGTVLSLDGNGDYVRISGLFGQPTNVTLAAWVNLNTPGASGAEVISLGDSVMLRLDRTGGAGVQGSFYDGSAWRQISSGVFVAGTGWNHVALSFDDANNVQSLYLNGVLIAQTNFTGSISYTRGPNTFIGSHGNGHNGWDFNGLIDDARIYTRALSADEIAALASGNPEQSETIALTVNPVNDAPTFDAGTGFRTLQIPGATSSQFNATVVQPDGKIIAVGRANFGANIDAFIARFNVDGSLDTTFAAGNGYFSTNAAAYLDSANDVIVLSSGKILVVGWGGDGGSSTDMLLIRLNADGSVDTTFGGGTGFSVSSLGGYDEATSVVELSDGKLLVAGKTSNNFIVGRFNANGSVDTSFGTSGFVTTDFASGTDEGNAIVTLTDGKFMVAGRAWNGSSFDFGIVRYNANGSLDTSFGTGGRVMTDFLVSTNDVATSIAVQADGKFIVSGWSNAAGTIDFALARYNFDGSLDTTFGGTGKVVTPIGSGSDFGMTLAIQPDGKIVVAGYSNTQGNNFAIIRLNSDGWLDTTFNGTGKVDFNFGGTSDDRARGVVIAPDGKIVVVGSTTVTGSTQSAIARFNLDGSLDTRFNLTSTLGGTVNYTENGFAVHLDTDVTIFDTELSATNNFNGSTLTLARNGGANAQDMLGFDGINVTTSGANVIVSGVTVGTFTFTGGEMTITFNANATQARVNTVMRNIVYWNTSDAPPDSVVMDWVFDDGNSGEQGSGGALTAIGYTTISITAVNDAPILDNNGNMTLTTINEDQVNNSGNTVAAIIASAGGTRITDPDGVGLPYGIAITSLNSGNGIWQYSIDGGTNWINVGAVSNTSALLLREIDRVRFVPNAENGTTADFTFRAWDQTGATAGQQGTKVDVSVNGGTTAFSTATELALVTVTSVNDAPVLTPYSPKLPLTEDSAPYTNTVASLLGGSVTDVDMGAVQGIAITSVTGGGGALQYSTDGGATWQNFSSLSVTEALLLRATDQLRFTPNGQNGGTTLIEYYAWDQTSGSAGSTADVTTRGGTTAFSLAGDVVTVEVADINDAPTITNGHNFTLTATDENTPSGSTFAGTILFNASWADVDNSAIAGMAITSTSGNGTWQYSTDDITWQDFGAVSDTNALLIGPTTRIRYVPDGENGESADFTYRAWDQTSGTVSTNETPSYSSTEINGGTSAFSTNVATASIDVADVNDAPVNLLPANQFTQFETDLVFSSGNGNLISISDVDAGSSELEVTLSITGGTLTLSGTAGLNFTVGDGAADATMTFTGTLNDINAALDGLTFTPTAGYRGLAQLSIVTDDQGNTGSGGALSDSSNLQIHVGAIVVTTTADTANGDVSSFEMLVANDGGDGISLREAILVSNNVPGLDYIYFQIDAVGTQIIELNSLLPTITDSIVIDATTQPGWVENSFMPIVIDGNGLTGHAITLEGTAGGSEIRGLVIRDFDGRGIVIEAGADNNVIAGNWIGSLNSDGSEAVAETVTGVGIFVESANNTIGGMNAGDRNIFAGLATSAIRVFGEDADNNVIINNWIGLTPDGLSTYAGGGWGIDVSGGGDNTIIGTIGAGNWIAGGSGSAIRILGESSGTIIQSNRIGTDITGTENWGMGAHGIYLSGGANNNLIGGFNPGEGNIIAFSNQSDGSNDGIRIFSTAGVDNAILGNIIYGTVGAGHGIDIAGDGVTANDLDDSDTGSNNSQNFPVLTLANSSGGDTRIVGSINTYANTTYRIEFFSSPSGHASGHGEAAVYLGFATITTDADGNASFDVTLSGVIVAEGHAVTATATVDYGAGSFGSTSEFAANMIVTAADNFAPTITPNAVVTLPSINEDSFSAGVLASSILADANWNDIDASPLSGIAVTGVTANGTWQYSTDGNQWHDFGAVSQTSALLLSLNTQIRFVGDNENGEVANLTFHAWDQTSGTASDGDTREYADVTSNGGTTAFSAETASVEISVTDVNDAPVLDNIGSISLDSITENDTQNSGQTVASFAGARITDVDSGSLAGIAIISTENGNGTWQYSVDDGATWIDVGIVANDNALLLRHSDIIRFMPNGENGTTADFTFRAWDQTSGDVGTKVDTSDNGGATAFSTATAVASIEVLDVNDAPSGSNNTITIDEDDFYTFSSADFGFTDIDWNNLERVWIMTLPGAGELRYDGATFDVNNWVSRIDLDLGRLTYHPAPDGNGLNYATFEFQVEDDGGTDNGGQNRDPINKTITFDVNPVNDAPTVTNPLQSQWAVEDRPFTFVIPGNTFADVDIGDTLTYSATLASGDPLPSWLSFDPVTGTFTGTALNEDVGTIAVRVTATDSGGLTASSDFEITITNSADAPTLLTVDTSGGLNTAIPLDISVSSTSLAGDETIYLTISGVPAGATLSAGTDLGNGVWYLTDSDLVGLTITPPLNDGSEIVLSVTARANTAFPSGALAAYEFDGANPLADSSGNNRDLAEIGPVPFTDGIADLSETDHYLNSGSVAPVSLTGDYSISFWARPDSIHRGAVVALYNGTGQGALIEFQLDGNLRFLNRPNGGTVGGNNIIVNLPGYANGDWLQVTAVRAGNEMFLYVNGELVGSAATTSGMFDDLYYNIGRLQDGNPIRAFDGGIDRVAIFDRALTTEEIAREATVRVGTTTTQTLTVTVNNSAPVSNSDSAIAVEAGGIDNGTTGVNPLGNVLANDTDPDVGDVLAVVGVAAGTPASANGSVGESVAGLYGSIVIAEDGTYTYTVDNDNATVQALRTASDTLTDVFTYTIEDSGGLASTTQITITIQGANDTPNDITTTGLTIAENGSNGASVGTVVGWDIDAGDVLTYSLEDDAGGRFTINTTTGEIFVANANLIDYEVAASHTIVVRVTDLEGAWYEKVKTIAVVDTNDAPVLDHQASFSLATITEDQVNNGGQTVASIITSGGPGSITDQDAGAVQGIAITDLETGNGTWQYSVNGGSTWINVGTVSDSSALLLRDTDLVRFVPNGQTGTTADFTFRAWDRTSGTAGTKVDSSVNGGTTAFSNDSAVAEIVVADVNDAPVLNVTQPFSMVSITEDEVNNPGQSVASILASNGGNPITDVDGPDSLRGIAMRTTSGNGTWQYSLNGGATWQNVGNVLNGNALLLREGDWIRFVPDGENGTNAGFTFRAWDQTAGTAGTKVDTSSTNNGGTSPHSNAIGTVNLSVTDVNDAPVVNPAGNFTFSSIAEDTPSAANAGTTVGDLIASAGPAAFSDVDNGAVQGIAVTGIDNNNGTWFYSLDGTTWISLADSGVSISGANNSSALLLDTTALLRFEPRLDFYGEASITFRGWDQTSGSNGQSGVDVSVNGGTTSFSASTATAIKQITPVNDAPEFLGENEVINGTFDADLTGWTASGNVGYSAGVVRFGGFGGGINGQLSQTFNTVPGQVYYITFQYGDMSATQSQSMRLQIEGSETLLNTVITSGVEANTLQPYTFRFVATDATTTIVFADESSSHSGVRGYLDNISVKAVVENITAISYTEKDPPVAVHNQINLGDIDSTHMSSAVIRVRDNFVADRDVLSFTNQFGITGNWDAINGTLTLTGVATIEQYQTALRSITYHNTSNYPSEATRTVSFQVNDGGSNSIEFTRDIFVTSVNDAPEIAIGANDSASETIVETNSGITTSGTLTVTDIDLPDTVTATVTSVSTSGTTTGLQSNNAALLAMLSLVESNIIDGTTETGQIAWNFNSGTEAFDYLAVGESLVLTYTITATDSQNDTDTETVTITVTGTNDAPVFSIEAGNSAGASLGVTGSSLTTDGTLSVADLDRTDAVTAAITNFSKSGNTTGLMLTDAELEAFLSLVDTDIISNTQQSGTINWEFDSDGYTFGYLAVGESITLTYTITVTDSQNVTATQDITIVINGANTAPDITIEAGDSNSDTLAETNTTLTSSGTLSVLDINTTDTVTATVTSVSTSGTTTGLQSNNAALLAMLSLVETNIIDGTTENGQIAWNFHSGAEAFDYLATGESLVLTYTITATDSQNDTDTETVTITVTGTNDAPVITVEVGNSAGDTLYVDGNSLTTDGTLSVADLDRTDAVTAAITNFSKSGNTTGLILTDAELQAFLSLVDTDIISNTQQAGTISWQFDSNGFTFGYLAAGESITLTYTITATDSQNVTATQDITIVINGANTAPDITIEAGDSNSDTLAETNTTLTSSGALTVLDINTTDTVTATVTSVATSGTTTGLQSNNAALLAMLSLVESNVIDGTTETGQIAWNFKSGSEAFDYLAAGESLILTYTITATDSQNETDTETVTITVTGTNDAPVIAVEAGNSAGASLGVTGSSLTTAGALSVVDLDRTDTVTAAITNFSKTGNTTGLTLTDAELEAFLSLVDTDIISNTQQSGTIQWEFDSDGYTFGYLAVGESITLTYTITVTDSQNVTATQDITVVINGANTAPDITIGAGDSNSDTLTETNTTLTSSGTLSVLDINTTDTVTATVTSVSTSGTTTGLQSNNAALLAMLSLVESNIIDGTSETGKITWNFNSGTEAIDYLAAGESLVLTYTITATDSQNDSGTHEVNITIVGTNDAPQLTAGYLNVAENSANGTVVGSLIGTDLDVSDILVFSLVNDAGGRFAINSATGVITVANGALLDYETNTNHAIRARVTDSAGAFSELWVTIVVDDVNEAPVANDNRYTTNFIENLVIGGSGILANDFDPDGDSLSAILVSGPIRGTLLSFSPNGSFQYRPEVGFQGTVVFTYMVTDGELLSKIATVSIDVVMPPVAQPSSSGGSSSSSSNSGSNSTSNSGNSSSTSGTSGNPSQNMELVAKPVAPLEGQNREAEEGGKEVDSNAVLVARIQETLEQVQEAQGKELKLGLARQSLFTPTKFDSFGSSLTRFEYFVGEKNIDLSQSDSFEIREDSRRTFDENEKSSIQFSMDSVLVKTAIGSGAILMVMQGAQLAATLMAVNPALLQFDPLTVMAGSRRGEQEELSKGEKLFDK